MPEVPRDVGLFQPFAVGRGFPEVARLVTPAAGGGFTYTVEGRYWERIASLSFLLTNDGNAGSRIVSLAWQDQDSLTYARVACPFTQAATVASQYTFAMGIQQAGANDAATMDVPIPGLFLRPRHKLVVAIATVKAGDAITVPAIYRERFDTGPAGYGMGSYVVVEPVDAVASEV